MILLKFPFFSILSFFSIIAAFSCSSTNQTQPTPSPPKIHVAEKIASNAESKDTSLLLKYTTGIRAILEDRNGNIWFASHQEGVCKYDGKKFTYYTTADGLSHNQIRSIYEGANGVVWFEGGQGISSYENGKITSHSNMSYLLKTDWQYDANDLWFKGNEEIGNNTAEGEAGVYRYDGNLFFYHVFPELNQKPYGFSYSVSTPFVRGKDDMVWIGTYGAVIGYDGESFTIIDNDAPGFDETSGWLHVRSIFVDSKNNLWIGNNGIGVLLHDGKTNINISAAHGLISQDSPLSGGYRSPEGSLEHVFAIGEDNDGNMWFGDRDTGAWRFDGKAWKNFTTKDGLPVHHIWQIYNAKNGELWFAMGDGSVCKFNGASYDRIF